MLEGLLPNGRGVDPDAIMLLQPLRGPWESRFGPKVGHGPLQLQGVVPVGQTQTLAEGPQAAPPPAHAKHLRLNTDAPPES